MRKASRDTPDQRVIGAMPVTRYAFGAAALAAASAAVPGPWGVLLDVSGLDPVGYLQRRMLRTLVREGGEVFTPDIGLNRTAVQRRRASSSHRMARTLVEPVTRLLARTPVVRLLGRRSSRVIPVIGAIAVAVLAYRETHALASACKTAPK